MLEAQPAGSGRELDFTPEIDRDLGQIGSAFFHFCSYITSQARLGKALSSLLPFDHHAAWLLDSTLHATDLLWICH